MKLELQLVKILNVPITPIVYHIVFRKRAALVPEFAKIICVSMAFVLDNGEIKKQTFSGDDETELLNRFAEFLQKSRQPFLCAHNGKEFDFPYLCRRMLVNGISLPSILDISGKKPWEIPHFDTLELWKFGDRKSYTSLDLLAAILDVKSSKDDIDGSEVGKVYYQEKNLERIAAYCKKDVVTLAQVFLKMNGHKPMEEKQIAIVE